MYHLVVTTPNYDRFKTGNFRTPKIQRQVVEEETKNGCYLYGWASMLHDLGISPVVDHPLMYIYPKVPPYHPWETAFKIMWVLGSNTRKSKPGPATFQSYGSMGPKKILLKHIAWSKHRDVNRFSVVPLEYLDPKTTFQTLQSINFLSF